jgi:hypothetical protein
MLTLGVVFWGAATYSHAAAEDDELQSTANEETAAEQLPAGAWYDVFYEKIIPIITGVCAGFGGLLIAAYPLVKTVGKLNSARTALKLAQQQINEYEKSSGANIAAILEKTVTAKLQAYDGALANVLAESNVNAETLNKFIAAATVVWRSNPDAVKILSEVATVTAHKKLAIENEKLRALIVGQKGTEADAIIASAVKEAEAAVL